MSTPATAIAGGFFAQLMPMLADRTVMMIVSKADEHHLTVSVIPKRLKDSENAALATPFCCTGTPEELDRELPTQVREFVAGHVALGANLAEIQREREEAEKVRARGTEEEAKDSGERWSERQGGRTRTEAGRQASTCTAVIAHAEPLRSTRSR
jgi:PRTRC genetic system protein E